MFIHFLYEIFLFRFIAQKCHLIMSHVSVLERAGLTYYETQVILFNFGDIYLHEGIVYGYIKIHKIVIINT